MLNVLTLDTNLKTVKATTQFTNYDFNSMVNFGGRQVAVNDSGIFDLGGDTDDGVKIRAYFEPVMTDFGQPRPKHVRFIYFGFESDADLELTVIDDSGAQLSYEIRSVGGGRQQRARVAVSRELQGRYWTFRVGNAGGGDFSVDTMDVIYLSRSHGISQNS